jgi:hypothetical protein
MHQSCITSCVLCPCTTQEARDRRQQAVEGGQASPPLALPRPRVQSPSPAANMAPQACALAVSACTQSWSHTVWCGLPARVM